MEVLHLILYSTLLLEFSLAFQSSFCVPSDNGQVLLEHREDVKLESVVVAQGWLTVFERQNGLRAAVVYRLPEVGTKPASNRLRWLQTQRRVAVHFAGAACCRRVPLA